MFPHTITIFHHSIEKGEDVYTKTVLRGCYWMHNASRGGIGKGTEKTDSYTVILSPEQTRKYGSVWKVCPGDRVIKGYDNVAIVGDSIAGVAVIGRVPITAWKEIKGDVMVVKAVEENICGSSVDNITLIG